MAITGWSTGDFLRVLSGLGFTAADDLIISGWMFEPVSINAGFMCDLGDTVSNDRRGVTSRLGGPPRASINEAGAGSIQANATAEEPNDQWYHLLGWYSDFDAAQIFLNGGNSGGASGAPVNPQDPNAFTVGANTPLGADAGATVGSGEISAWDPTSFTQQNIVDLTAALTAGDNPLALNAQAAQPWTGRLRRYYRLLNIGDLADLTGSGDDLSITGTLSNFATHPPVDPVPGQAISKDTAVQTEALRTIQKGGPVQKLDHPVAGFAWSLQADDEGMTLRQLANMTSSYGYGADSPGQAFAYGNSGSGLLSETLTDAAGGDIDNIAVPLFAPLQLEDTPSDLFDRHADGRIQLILTARDFARIGWLLANRGNWDGQQVLPDIFFAPLTEFGTFGDRFGHIQVPVSTPVSVAAFSPGDYLGVSGFPVPPENETAFGPGTFGYAWYFNGTNPGAVPQWPDLPADTMVTTGNFGSKVIIIIPSEGLVVCCRANTSNGSLVVGQVDTPASVDPQFNDTVALLVNGITGAGLVSTFPGATWTDITDAQAEISTTALDNFIAAVSGEVDALGVITRNGYMVRMWGNQTTAQQWASSRKAIFAVLAGTLTTAITNQTVKGTNTAGDDVDHDHPTGDLLLVAPSWFDSGVDVSTLTFNGVPLSELETLMGVNGTSVALYQLSNPLVGSRNIAVTFTGAVGQTGIFAASIANGEIRTINSNQAQFENVPITATVTVPSQPGDLVLGFLRWKNSSSDVTDTGGASIVLTDNSPTRQLMVAFPASSASTTFNIDLSAGGQTNEYVFIAVSIEPTPPLISLTPFESLDGVRHDRTIPIESEGPGVLSRDIIVPIETLTLTERANIVPLESRSSITGNRVVLIESFASLRRSIAVPLESLFSLVRDRLVPFESEGVTVVSRDLVIPFEALTLLQLTDTVAIESLIQLIRARSPAFESLISVIRDRFVPFESEGVEVISRDIIVPFGSLSTARRDRSVAFEAIKNITIDREVVVEVLIPLTHDVTVPFGTFPGIVRSIVVPFEAEGQIIVPPLEIQLIETAQPLTIRLIPTLQMLSILLMEM